MPVANRRVKNDHTDAEMLSRLLATRNITEVFVPDGETEALQAITRTLEDAREDLARSRQRLTKFLLELGHLLDEVNERGQRAGNWTRSHWAWIRRIELKEPATQETLDYCMSEVRHFEDQKKVLERMVKCHAAKARWRGRVAAFCRLKGIDRILAAPRRKTRGYQTDGRTSRRHALQQIRLQMEI